MVKTLEKLSEAISTGLFSGHLPGPSGTWGSLVAVLLWCLLGGPTLGTAGTLFGAFLITIVGTLSTKIFLATYSGAKAKDPSCVVIDEWAGMWIALAGALSLYEVALAFILFRLLDAVKPYPINVLESAPGAAGVMLDDLGAGCIALLLLNGLVRL